VFQILSERCDEDKISAPPGIEVRFSGNKANANAYSVLLKEMFQLERILATAYHVSNAGDGSRQLVAN
jgi:hypothetical protein